MLWRLHADALDDDPQDAKVRESEICFHTDGDPDASIACQSAVNEVPSLDYYEMSNVK
jgi:hypothetical protein